MTMKKLFSILLLAVLTASSYAGTGSTPRSFITPGVTYIQLRGGTAGQGVTNLDSFQKFPMANGSFVNPVITNVSVLWSNVIADKVNGFIIVATNITAPNSITNVVAGITNVYGTGLSNVFMPYTNMVGPVQAGVHGVTNGNFNLLSSVVLNNDVNHSQQPAPLYTLQTNCLGTLQFTTIADGSNVCLFTFVSLPDGTNEDTDGKGTFTVTVTNALGIRTTEAVLPNWLPGVKALRLQSITSTGGPVASQANQTGILGVNLVDDAP